MTKQRIIDNPSEWIITKRGDFVRINDSEIYVEKKLKTIREHLKKPYKGAVRFRGKTPEQVSKERYDKVLEEVNFDYDKLHDWIYDEKNKDKIEIVKLEGQDFSEATESIFNHIKNSRQKWRIKKETLTNEETGQIIYFNPQISGIIDDLRTNWDYQYNGGSVIIREAREHKTKEKHTSTLIFLHGTYASGSLDQMAEKFPGLKVIHPFSPVLQYDMWHGSQPAPGSQEKG
ncbi:5433_t:CDS:1 [Paraglomus occultum]|uniref:5433_t:CDS:1 n=1 Tax=Paraglomus occultum TaxID=144539 RepID=A0A9N8ZPQ4_9GLOM|nr:5433_t:CDS:1 [Paraglomus occultum]